ncbi:MAG: hypothetical protein HGJ94_15795 [Desulfosarcina sp.]|nr:hypothetical protein [Desulfosarcina sp.]MBC2742037.1 hypothetical protein [Desulfosarcina sp.]MBC2764950.1 hypothetical protein [Desulfosarcina sp.]
MTPAYMPFTYLSEPTARLLNALVGPVVLYQPLEKKIPESLSALASQGLVEIRTPMTRDDDRLQAALAEFTDWARMNPGRSTPGTGFFSARQGEIPFFDETAINRIRSDIKRYRQSDHLADHQSDETEVGFSARLFLAVAQENDMAADRLDHDLNRFKALEKDFLEVLKDADEAGFNRQTHGGTIWREDPGTKLTGQRIRAWAALAAADAKLPELLVTTSSAVIDTLLETSGEALRLEKLADMRLCVPSAGTTPVLGRVLADLAVQETLPSADLSAFASLAAELASEPAVTVTLFVAANRTPATVISRVAPATASPPEENGKPKSVRHTLIVLVEG